MKKIALLLFFTISLGFSQEIKTKKDKVLLNKKEVAKIDKKKGIYYLNSLDDKQQYSFDRTNEFLVNGRLLLTYQVKNLIDNQENTLMYQNPIIHISGESTLLNNLILKSDFITENGVENEKFNHFFSNKINKEERITHLNDSINQRLKNAKEKFNTTDFFFSGWDIVRKNAEGKNDIVAYITKTPISTFHFRLDFYVLRDGQFQKVAFWANGETRDFENKISLKNECLITINDDGDIYLKKSIRDDLLNIGSSELIRDIIYIMYELGYF